MVRRLTETESKLASPSQAPTKLPNQAAATWNSSSNRSFKRSTTPQSTYTQRTTSRRSWTSRRRHWHQESKGSNRLSKLLLFWKSKKRWLTQKLPKDEGILYLTTPLFLLICVHFRIQLKEQQREKGKSGHESEVLKALIEQDSYQSGVAGMAALQEDRKTQRTKYFCFFKFLPNYGLDIFECCCEFLHSQFFFPTFKFYLAAFQRVDPPVLWIFFLCVKLSIFSRLDHSIWKVFLLGPKKPQSSNLAHW